MIQPLANLSGARREAALAVINNSAGKKSGMVSGSSGAGAAVPNAPARYPRNLNVNFRKLNVSKWLFLFSSIICLINLTPAVDVCLDDDYLRYVDVQKAALTKILRHYRGSYGKQCFRCIILFFLCMDFVNAPLCTIRYRCSYLRLLVFVLLIFLLSPFQWRSRGKMPHRASLR